MFGAKPVTSRLKLLVRLGVARLRFADDVPYKNLFDEIAAGVPPFNVPFAEIVPFKVAVVELTLVAAFVTTIGGVP